MWCDVVRGRSTEREAASHRAGSTNRVERINESTNQTGSHGRVHLPNRIFTAHTNLPVFYYFTVLMFIGFGQKKTEPANRQIWFAIQFTTNALDGGDFKRLWHGRTKRFVPALSQLRREI